MKRHVWIICLILLLSLTALATIEDLSDEVWTEDDTPGEITLVDIGGVDCAWYGNIEGNDSVGLYRAHSCTTTFTHYLETKFLYYSSSICPEIGVWGITNSSRHTEAAIDAADDGVTLQWDYDGGRKLRIKEWDGDSSQDTASLSDNTYYWVKVVGNGTACTVSVYSSAEDRTAGSNLVTSASVNFASGSDTYDTFCAAIGEGSASTQTLGLAAKNYELDMGTTSHKRQIFGVYQFGKGQ